MLRKIFIMILALPLLLPAQYSRKLFFIQNYQKATVLNGTSQYWTKASPSNLDLNGSEMITNANNTGFGTNLGDWANFGNHSAVRSTVDKKTGTASMKITSSGAGDTTANFMYLPPSALGTMVAGNKYTIELWVRSGTATSTITLNVGTQSATSGTLSTTFGTFTKAVFNFTALTSTDTLKIYANKAIDSLYVDDVSLKQAYDLLIVSNISTTFSGANNNFLSRYTSGGVGWLVRLGSTGLLVVFLRDDGLVNSNTVGLSGVTLNDGTINSVAVTLNRTGSITLYAKGSSATSSISGYGNFSVGSQQLQVGIADGTAPTPFSGNLGFTQIVRFSSLPSDIGQTIADISARKKPKNAYANGQIVAWYDWKSGGTDLSGNGNHLTPVGSPSIITIHP